MRAEGQSIPAASARARPQDGPPAARREGGFGCIDKGAGASYLRLARSRLRWLGFERASYGRRPDGAGARFKDRGGTLFNAPARAPRVAERRLAEAIAVKETSPVHARNINVERLF